MTLSDRKYKFAFIPRKCSCCDRLFIWEFYETYYRPIGFTPFSINSIRCYDCIKKGRIDSKIY